MTDSLPDIIKGLLFTYYENKISVFWDIVSIACEMERVIRELDASDYDRMKVENGGYFELPIPEKLDAIWGTENYEPEYLEIRTKTIEMKLYRIRNMSNNIIKGDYSVRIGVGHKTKRILYHCYEKEEIPTWV